MPTWKRVKPDPVPVPPEKYELNVTDDCTLHVTPEGKTAFYTEPQWWICLQLCTGRHLPRSDDNPPLAAAENLAIARLQSCINQLRATQKAREAEPVHA